MRIETFLLRLRTLGALPCHEQRVLRAWLAARPLDAGTRRQKSADFLPGRLRDALPELSQSLASLLRLHSEHPGADGSSRLLLELADRQMIESVLLPRNGLCVSTQVGCAVACTFCMTGRGGLQRQLGSAEILAQVVLARQLRTVQRVVFMGMGEPAHNLDNVLEAVERLGTEGGIGHKNLVFSTVGDRRVFERLPRGSVKPALAISLHTTDAALRCRLLPNAPRMTPQEIIEEGERYARATGYPIQYQWTLLEDINDSLAEMTQLSTLLAGKYAMVNFIPFNHADGLAFRRPTPEHAAMLAGYLHQRGLIVRLRQSAGQDIDGGCGQLRARRTATQ